MNPLNIVVVLAAMIACSHASALGLGLVALNPAAQIPSGSVSVGVNGAVVAGPSGSVRTDNGLAGLGAAAQLSGPAGDVRTRGGAVALDGPGIGLKGIGIAAPAVIAAPTLIAAPAVAKVGLGGAVVGPAGLGIGLNGLGGAVVGPAGLGIGLNGLGLGLGGAVVGPAGLGIGLNGLGLGLGGIKAW